VPRLPQAGPPNPLRIVLSGIIGDSSVTTQQAPGVAVARLASPGSQLYRIQQISVSAPNSSAGDQGAANCNIFHNGQFVCASSQGGGDTASGLPGLDLSGADELLIVWGGLYVDPSGTDPSPLIAVAYILGIILDNPGG
jgi:hypothetical protein